MPYAKVFLVFPPYTHTFSFWVKSLNNDKRYKKLMRKKLVMCSLESVYCTIQNYVAYFTLKGATCNTLQSAKEAIHCGYRLPLLSATRLSSNCRYSSLSGFTFAVYFRTRIFTNLNETKTSFRQSKKLTQRADKENTIRTQAQEKNSKEFRRIKSRQHFV